MLFWLNAVLVVANSVLIGNHGIPNCICSSPRKNLQVRRRMARRTGNNNPYAVSYPLLLDAAPPTITRLVLTMVL
jgi:hypothetical protein